MMIRNYPQSRGFDFYRNGGVRIDPMREDQMRALERRMASFFQYHYQNGGQGPQLMYRPGIASGDMRTNFGISDRKVLDQYEMEALARERAKQAAEEERMRQLAAAASERARAEQRRKLAMIDARTTGDMAANSNIPTSEQARRSFDMGQAALEKPIRDREQLQHNLGRMGYEEKVAKAYARLGWDKIPKSAQKSLEDLAEGDMRVRYHPDFDPHLPIEQQQALKYDDSFRAGMFRQYNKLNDSGNPVMNLVTGALTAPAKAVMNLTMDADKQYYEPGLVQGTANLGNDLMTVFPTATNQFAGKIVSGVNRINPVGLGRQALTQLFERRAMQPMAAVGENKGFFTEPVSFERVPNQSGNAVAAKRSYFDEPLSFENFKFQEAPVQVPKDFEKQVHKAAMDYGNVVKDPRYLERVKVLDNELGMNGELRRRRDLFLQQMDKSNTTELPFNIKIEKLSKDVAGESRPLEEAMLPEILQNPKKYLETIKNFEAGQYPTRYYTPMEREIAISPEIGKLKALPESTTSHELKHHWTNALADDQGGIQNYADWLRKSTISESDAALKGINPKNYMYHLNPTEIDAHLMTELRNDLVNQGYMKDHFSELSEDQLADFIKKNKRNVIVRKYFGPGQKLVQNNNQFLNIFNKALPAVVPAAVVGAGVMKSNEQQRWGGSVMAMPFMR